jgi:hypothetical protein
VKKLKAKERALLEKNFLSCLIAAADDGDVRETTRRYGINWRHFRDKRHRAIWRALEALDLRSPGERQEALQDEMNAWDEGKELGVDYFPEEMVSAPGSPLREQYFEELEKRSRGLACLERGLETAGALSSAGGEKYLREVAEAYPVAVDGVAGGIAARLGFI